MSFNRFRTQLECEILVGCKNVAKWNSYQPSFEKITLDTKSVNVLCNALNDDSKYLYFKGLLSLCEAISSINHALYSWATVKLYYSMFYFLRSSLALRGYAIARNKCLYLLKVKDGEKPQKKSSERYRNDHLCVINVYRDLYEKSDVLQSNTIDGLNSYEWLMEKRNQINYREREFHDPDYPDFFHAIATNVKAKRLDTLITKYVDDPDYIYCFQVDHACLALPIKRALLTKKEFLDMDIKIRFAENKMALLTSLLQVDSKLLTRATELVNTSK